MLLQFKSLERKHQMMSTFKILFILSVVVGISTSFNVDQQPNKSKFLLVELEEENDIPQNPTQGEAEEIEPGTRKIQKPQPPVDSKYIS